MLNTPPSDLEAALNNLSTETWERLGDIKAFSQRPEPFNRVRYGETTITDLAMMYLCRHQVSRSLFLQTPQNREQFHGTDFEWWLGSTNLGWFRLAVQAKKLDMREDKYLKLGKKVSGVRQVDVLTAYAVQNRATPLYCLYNFSETVNPINHWHCCQRPITVTELGCSIAPANRIRQALNTRGKRTFDYMLLSNHTIPWQCLASCPGAMQALHEGRTPSSPDPFPLFDRGSFHDQLPPFESAAEGFGSEITFQGNSINDDTVFYKLEAVRLTALDEYYAVGAGFPRSILVTEVDLR